MCTTKTLMATALLLALGHSAAVAETYTFQPSSGVWHLADNWRDSEDNPGIPGAYDDAIIPSDTDCTITGYSEECYRLNIRDDATLTIADRRHLKLGDPNPNNPTSSMISGELRIDGVGDDPSYLVINYGGVTLNDGTSAGIATVTASKGAGLGPAYIGVAGATGNARLTVQAGVTVKGHIRFWCDVKNDSTFVVDHADDLMRFDQVGGNDDPEILGTGRFDVSAGTLEFQDCTLVYDSTTTWDVSGGTIHVTSQVAVGDGMHQYTGVPIELSGGELWVEQVNPTRFKTNGAIDISGGTLDLDGVFTGAGGLTFSGGTIELAQGKSASFEP